MKKKLSTRKARDRNWFDNHSICFHRHVCSCLLNHKSIDSMDFFTIIHARFSLITHHFITQAREYSLWLSFSAKSTQHKINSYLRLVDLGMSMISRYNRFFPVWNGNVFELCSLHFISIEYWIYCVRLYWDCEKHVF